MRIQESNRRYIFLGSVLFVLIAIFVANVMGKSQDKVYVADEALYNEMVTQLQQGQYELALEKFHRLEKQQENSEVANYIVGLAAANAGHINMGVQHFQRVLDINPHKVEDSMFMLQFAELLVMANMMEEAEIVLERCEMLPTPEDFPQYQETILEMKKLINGQS
ncbi:hypothetical protein M3152_02295 [Sporosarcina luteola]|uniref:tetratricopeptide repeat protein n=1 Tax=Sporosarcina luteola TaxID=582850 RepID=UPI00203B923E|nr:hypothetical protein [Sporosarcina luteola]MCM3636535.1 hypothetical protein [Sporosarcina luteola]